MKQIFTELKKLIEEGKPAMLVSIIACEGSAPRGSGARMLVAEEGQICGTIGGGAVEKKAEIVAQRLIGEQKSLLKEYKLNVKDEDDIGMICGGDVTVHYCFVPAGDAGWKNTVETALSLIEENKPGYFVEPLNDAAPYVVAGGKDALSEAESGAGYFSEPLPIGERLIIFGGGHIAKELVPIAAQVGFRPVIFENRPDFADIARFRGAERTILGDFQNIKASIDIRPDDFIVIMTNGHVYDYYCEEQVLRYDVAYIGVIGSRSKIAAVNKRLLEAGIPQEKIDTEHKPIGINIKAVTPEEIAVSIAAELILERTRFRAARGEDTASCPMHLLHH
ncbi:MAG: XdhC family protein [Oscillospiraceae bacterium]|nr:XdhC family protein [Oscillospiraceae bacterium]